MKHDLTDDERLANLFEELDVLDDEEADYGIEEVKGMLLDFASHCRRLRNERDLLGQLVAKLEEYIKTVEEIIADFRSIATRPAPDSAKSTTSDSLSYKPPPA